MHWGSTCSVITRNCEAPAARPASTKGISRTLMATDRITRPPNGMRVTAIAAMTAGRPVPTPVALGTVMTGALVQPMVGAGVEVIGFNKGGTVQARGLRVTMTHADHSAGDWSAAGEGPLYLGEAAGFVVELEDGRRLYHAGDTALFSDLRLIGEIYRPDLAMLGVTAVLPLHYGTFPILAGTPDALRAALADRGLGGITVHSPEPGGSIVLDPY